MIKLQSPPYTFSSGSSMSSPPSAEVSPRPDARMDLDEPSPPPVVRQTSGLRIPQFAASVTEPLSLNERISVFRKPKPVGPKRFISDNESMTSSPLTPRDSDSRKFSILVNLSSKCSESALKNLIPFARVCYPRIRVISISENCRGKFDQSALRLNELISVPSLAIADMAGRTATHLIAYGTKSDIVSSDLEWTFFAAIFRYFSSIPDAWTPVPLPPQGESKFGGGLGRRSAAGQLAGRFVIRGRYSGLESLLTEDEMKRRGIVAAEREGEFMILRFTRMEQRDFACNSFILCFEVDSRQFGVSTLRTAIDTEETVLIENWNSDNSPPWTPIDFRSFFPTANGSMVRAPPTHR